MGNHFPKIQNVVIVDGLGHNLSSIGQLCAKGNMILLESSMCLVQRDTKISFSHVDAKMSIRLPFRTSNQNVKCFSVLEKDSWLWHRRLGHAHTDLINKFSN